MRKDFDRQDIGRRLLLGASSQSLATEANCHPGTVASCAMEVLKATPGFDFDVYCRIYADRGLGPIKAMRKMYGQLIGGDG